MSSDRLTFFEEFFFVLQTRTAEPFDPIQISAQIDLAEFNFTEAELQKLRRLARKLEFALSDELNRQSAAASVVVELRHSEAP